MTKPQDEFSLVEIEADEEIFEAPVVEDVTTLAHWAPAAVDRGVTISDAYTALGEALKKRGKEMVAAGQSRINWAKNFREALKAQMNLDGSTEILGIDWRICVQKAKPRLVIDDEAAVPEAYKRTVTVTEIDKEALRQDLELGVPVAGARLESEGSLRIRPNTKKGNVA